MPTDTNNTAEFSSNTFERRVSKAHLRKSVENVIRSEMRRNIGNSSEQDFLTPSAKSNLKSMLQRAGIAAAQSEGISNPPNSPWIDSKTSATALHILKGQNDFTPLPPPMLSPKSNALFVELLGEGARSSRLSEASDIGEFCPANSPDSVYGNKTCTIYDFNEGNVCSSPEFTSVPPNTPLSMKGESIDNPLMETLSLMPVQERTRCESIPEVFF